jgi:hypothetical protein
VHYSMLIAQMKSRIEELEDRLENTSKHRSSIVEGELSELREQLAAVKQQRNDKRAASERENNNTAQNHNNTTPMSNGTSAHMGGVSHSAEKQPTPSSAEKHQREASVKSPPLPPAESTPASHSSVSAKSTPSSHGGHATPRGSRHAGMNARAMPLSAAPTPPHYERFMSTDEMADYRCLSTSSTCESPIPRISEPASPALPQKFLHHHRRILFPLRKRYIQAENEFWRENVEAQGLQVLQWSTDEVCQLLIHMGLEKYIPEFTVNQVTGPKFLDLDGTKLKGMGISNHSDRSIIKKKIKTIKVRIERERKVLEKESRARATANKMIAQ